MREISHLLADLSKDHSENKKGVWENIPNAFVEIELMNQKHAWRAIRHHRHRRYDVGCFVISYTP